jgi:methyl-accepting chemotaxis protein
MKQAEDRPGGSVDDRDEVLSEILRLAHSMAEGQLDERGDAGKFTGSSAQVVGAVNSILDSLIVPLRLATSSLRELAHGSIPPDFIVTEYKGEFNDIKRNLNTFLAVLYGVKHEMHNLVQSIKDGKLYTRGNDWDFEGTWRDLIAGLNETIDATLDPVMEARSVLDRLATYDLTVRMCGKYKRDHAQIKKALNSSLQSLQDAFQQVAGAVSLVTKAADEISRSSNAVAEGAADQAQSLKEISGSMEEISMQTKQTAENTLRTSDLVKKAHGTVESGKTAMVNLLTAMEEIRAAAEGTRAIMQEINAITVQTDDLARNAAREATRVGSSARGFAVVADEVRKLARRSKTAADQISQVCQDISGVRGGEFAEIKAKERDISSVASELDNMALQTNYLALNAAVEAAYVDAAGTGIQEITVKVQDLAANSKVSASKTEGLLVRSVNLAENGQTLSGDVNNQLMEIVAAVTSVSSVIDEIAQASQVQAEELEGINESISRLNNVTQVNADSAERGTRASGDLRQQTSTLSDSIRRFRLDAK